MTYECLFSCDVGKLCPSVGEIIDLTNSYLTRDFGCDDKLAVRAQILRATIDGVRDLSPEEQREMGEKIREAIAEKFPAFDVRCDVVRSQSGSQSESR